MKLTCHHCNQAIDLQAACEDSAARQLFALLALIDEAAPAMVAYLSLFRPTKQALRWSRALSLAEGVREIRDAH